MARPRCAAGGLGLAGVGTALCFVPGLDLVAGFSVMLIGVAVAMSGSVVGAGHTRRRRDLPRAWWLRFWTSRAGGWVARVAGFGRTGTGKREKGKAEQGAGSGKE